MSSKHYDNPVLGVPIEDVEDEMIGVITDCLKLNIRKTPDKTSEIVAIMSCGDKLTINTAASNDAWYAVCTVSGIDGFCMKKFVSVAQ